jgi:hypothetical protein
MITRLYIRSITTIVALITYAIGNTNAIFAAKLTQRKTMSKRGRNDLL